MARTTRSKTTDVTAAPLPEVTAAPMPTPPTRISVDLGNAYSNLIANNGISSDWRSVQGVISDANRVKELPFDHCLNIDGTWYVFGEAAYTFAPRSLEDFPAVSRYTSNWYRRNLVYAMHRAFGLQLSNGILAPELVMSLPARLYSNPGFVDEVRRGLEGEYHPMNTQNTRLNFRLGGIVFLPEGFGSYLHAAATYTQMERGLWYVVDLGYLTTDIVACQDGEYIPESADSDAAAGMGGVAQAVARYIEATQRVSLRPADIDPQLACDAIVVNGREVSIKATRDSALTALAARIARFITQKAAGQNLTGVLLTGGGAALISGKVALHDLPNPILCPDARRANVLGGLALLEA